MAEVVSALLSPIIIKLKGEINHVTEFKSRFQKLVKELDIMQSFLMDEENQGKKKTQTLNAIILHLQELVYDAEDILSDFQLKSVHRPSSLSLIRPWNLYFRYKMGKRIDKIISQISGLKSNMASYLRQHRVPTLTKAEEQDRSNRWSSPIYDYIVGLETESHAIKEWIFESKAVGIVGMAGMGKTTMAQKIFSDGDIKHYYEKRIWVSVSQSSTSKILKSMLRSLGHQSNGGDEGQMLQEINEALFGKRYLIVLDDVWREDPSWWQSIRGGLPNVNNSALIITTRIEEVAIKMGVQRDRIYEAKCLNDYESRQLFCRIVFSGDEDDPANTGELHEIGVEIVRKCNGLPLMIKAVGGIMLGKEKNVREWRRLADNFTYELAKHDDNPLLASLQVSYDELPSHLKLCLLTFAIYPEGSLIEKEQIVNWWIGEGFVSAKKEGSLTMAAESCIKALVGRCLLEAFYKNDGDVSVYFIHDRVYDLIRKIAKEISFYGEDKTSCRHLEITWHVDRINPKTRALVSTGEESEIAPKMRKRFRKCRYMRVLDASGLILDESDEMLDKIDSFPHLRYLSLHHTSCSSLPPALRKLTKLMILDVSDCDSLETLPSYLGTFQSLIILNVRNCPKLKSLPKGFRNLSILEQLLGFIPSKSGCAFEELGALQNLIKLEVCIDVDQIGEGETHTLRQLNNLEELVINFTKGGHNFIEKIEKFFMPENVGKLVLSKFPGNITPVWLNAKEFKKLTHLAMVEGEYEEMHQNFWGVDHSTWNIKFLRLEGLNELKTPWKVLRQRLPSLEVLEVYDCPGVMAARGGFWRRGDRYLK